MEYAIPMPRIIFPITVRGNDIIQYLNPERKKACKFFLELERILTLPGQGIWGF
jgi:hypothetical protein